MCNMWTAIQPGLSVDSLGVTEHSPERMQVLQERGETATRHGRATFAVLLLQDLAVVVLLMLVPLLSQGDSGALLHQFLEVCSHHVEREPLCSHSEPLYSHCVLFTSISVSDDETLLVHMAASRVCVSQRKCRSLVGGFLIIAKALGVAAIKAMVCITGIIFTGRMLLRPLMRRIAALQNADIFAATTLLVILGCSALTQMSGLSLALGAFLAGLLMAETEYALQVPVTTPSTVSVECT